MRFVPLFLLLAFLTTYPSPGQEVAPPTTNSDDLQRATESPVQPDEIAVEPAEEPEKNPVTALNSVRDSIRSVDEEIDELSAALTAATEVEREELEIEIKKLVTRRDDLQSDFESIATGIDPGEYDEALDEVFVLSDELDVLLRPIIGELKTLTEKPREIEKLQSDLSVWRKRLATTEAALVNLSKLPNDLEPELLAEVASTRGTWSDRKNQAQNRIDAIGYQLEQAQSNRPSFFESISEGLRSFFRSRGRNFLLCILVFFGVFALARFAHRRLDRHTPWKRKGERPFYMRLIDVGLNVFSFVGAVVVSLIVLYATGDWVLMGLAIILIFGIVIAAKNSLPAFYEQGRLLLNLGEIREGERVVYNGVPWKIERLSFYTILDNPELRGGHLRLPVQQLSGLISRPISQKGESWFPSKEGDWIDMGDSGKARVVSQTPEFVHLIKLGGAQITIPTTDFLSLAPLNLSNNFRISSVFGVDYDHQAICTTTIPEKMWAHLTKELTALVGDHEKLLSLKVEFSTAGASSLDYAILADFHGSLAARYQAIERAIQKSLVDCCNENNWGIPFTQITLHNAYPREAEPIVEPEPVRPRLP